MSKDFGGSVKPPRRNTIKEEIAKGTAADLKEAAPIEPQEQEPTEAAPSSKEKSARTEAEDRAARLAEGRTQGKKGLYAKRINMAFRPDVYRYVHVMAYSDGKSMTDFINESLLRQMKHDPEYKELQAITNKIKARKLAEEAEMREDE